MSLSIEAVDKFLTSKLAMSDWKLVLERSKLEFLQKLILAFGHHVYFQNVTFSALSNEDRKCPTAEEAVEMVVVRQLGGCCIHNNFVIKSILETLGFDSFIVAADIPAFPDVANSHVLAIVRLNDDQKQVYSIDVGFARPILNLIPLHNLPFRGKTGGYEFEVRFNEESGNYERVLYGGCCVFGKLKDSEGGQRIDYTFKLVPKEVDFFNPSLTKMFVDPESKFMGNFFLYRLLRVENEEDFEYVTILRKSMIHGTWDSVKETVFQSYEEMRPILQKYFPNIRQIDLDGALANYQKFEDDHPGLELMTI